MYKILIVEDDETIAGGLKNHLGKWQECDGKVVIDDTLKEAIDAY